MSDKIKFTVEANLPSGRTDGEQREWMQKFFDYYHPSLGARVSEIDVIERTPAVVTEPKKRHAMQNLQDAAITKEAIRAALIGEGEIPSVDLIG